MRLLKILLMAAMLVPLCAHADRDFNLVDLGGGIQIRLPEQPTDSAQQAAFASLSPAEQRSFYVKRQYIVSKMTKGLTKRGIKSGIRWVKDKVFALKDRIISSQSPAEIAVTESPLQWEQKPEEMTAKTQAFVETTVTSLVDNLWANSVDIARSNGLGLTFVGGGIFNATLGKIGYVFGRTLSMDIGVDFKSQEGYMRFTYDKQALKTGGISLDIGPMVDVLIHVTNPDVPVGDSVDATHTKLPVIGCFRYGPNYKAWGAQLGFSVFEMAGMWMAATGMPGVGAALIAATRAVGMATVYSTTLSRRVLYQTRASEKNLRRFGLGGLLDLAQDLKHDECDEKLSEPAPRPAAAELSRMGDSVLELTNLTNAVDSVVNSLNDLNHH